MAARKKGLEVRNQCEIYNQKKPLTNKQGVVFPQQKLPYEKYEEVHDKREAGASPCELADEYGVSVVSIRRAVRRIRLQRLWKDQ